MTMEEAISSSSGSAWSWDQDKAFESALAVYPEDSADRWEKIAEAVPGKNAEEVEEHYGLLVDDVKSIESGRVKLLSYGQEDGGVGSGRRGGSHADGGRASRAEQERRKGIAWTEEEHRLFLLGLDKYGKGDWRSISRNFVISRTPTQVASHAQKYFIRLNSMNKERRRASIHDITSVDNNNKEAAASQAPITGQGDIPAPIAGSTTIGQPVGSISMVTAVGTPVNIVGPNGPQWVRAPVVPGALMSVRPPATYPMHYAPTHR